MKVFTVGLEQKPPLEEGEKKSTSPPPGYSTTEARIPLPLGPEMPRAPLPPQPIIVRKSRGYKGILLVMLSVFLMAVFALVLSEMAYNRQRDENFFKLRWAELKHRMGYETDGPMEYYQRAAASIGDKFDRMLNLAKSNEINPPVAQSLSVDEDDATTSSTSSPPPTPPEPVVAIDTFPMKPDVSLGSSSSNSRSSQASFEIEPPQPPMFPGAGLGNALGQIRDARLQFLRNILQKIKQHAEDIGFDGTMQVSIIEVEPQNGMGGNDGQEQQNGDNNANNMNGPFGNMMGPFQRQLIIQQPNQQPQPQFPVQFPQMPSPQNFFPHPRPLVDDFKNSRSFLDGFGEFHQPNFMQNNQVNEQDEQQRPRMFGPMPNEFPPMGGSPPMPPMMQMQQQQMQQNGPPEFMENNMRWPRINAFRQPEMLFFHPIFPQQMNLRFPPPPPPSAEWAQPPQQPQQIGMNPSLARPSSFDRWNQQGGQQQQQQQQQPQTGGIPQGVLMAGEQPQQQIQQQQQQQPQAQLPQQQQIQIDFPEVKLPPPVISGDSTEDKFPVAPPQQQQGQKSQPQAQQQPRDWLPKWLTENMPTMVNNNAGGPPAQQPAEMVKFPSVTVLEPASNQQQGAKQIADNENREGGENMGREEGKVVDSARGEIGGRIDDGQPEEVVEVDAAPQQNEQQQPQQQGQSEGQTQQQGQQNGGPQGQQQQQQQMGTVPLQKWFPEVPSVFFQVDDPNDQQQQQPLVPQAQQQQPATQQQQQSADQPQQGTLGQPQSEH